MPKDHQWLAYADWGKEHGESCQSKASTRPLTGRVWFSGSDIVHFDVLGSHVIIVNTAKIAHELFDKRSAIYADRRGY